MMIPPFCDLGKATKDLFNKNYYFGLLSVDYSSKSSQGIELAIKGDNEIKSGKLNGSIQWNYKFDNGLKNTVKWDTKNVLSSNFSIEDAIKLGSKFTADLGFSPDSGNKTLKFQSSYKRKFVNFGMDFSFPNLKPVVVSNIVLGCTPTKGYLAGAELTFDTSRLLLTKHKFSLGFHKQELSLIGTMINGTDVEALVYQDIGSNVQVGVQINWNWNSRATEFGVAAKYVFDCDSFIKGKVNNKSLMGFAYGFRARDNVDVILNAEIDGKDLEKGNHRFGLGLSYSP